MRLPYVPKDISIQQEPDATILANIKKRRGSHGLLPLDQTLLHSFSVAEGWNSFLGAIRSKTTISPILREALICRVAVLNEADFEWDHHAPILLEAGLPQEGLGALRVENYGDMSKESEAGVCAYFEAADLAALAYADEMTRAIKVQDETFDALKKHFNAKEIVEITATVAAYNCVSRLLVALDVDERMTRTA